MKKIMLTLILNASLIVATNAQVSVTNYSTNIVTTTVISNGISKTTSVTNISPTSVVTTYPIGIMPVQLPVFTTTNSITVNNTTSTGFLNSFEQYFVSFGTNTWVGTKGFIETAAAYQKSINFGNEAEFAVDVKDFNTNWCLYPDVMCLNALGLDGVNATECGLKLGYRIHDVQVLVGIRGGYSFKDKAGEGSLSFQAQKFLTQNTFAYISFDPTFEGNKVKDYLIFGAGFKF